MGRALSALFDLGAIYFLFLIGRRLYGEKTGLLAAGAGEVAKVHIRELVFHP